MKDLAAREELRQRMRPARRVLGGLTGLIMVACGAVSTLSGALGHDFWNRFYTGGALGLNDAVPGAVILAVGLILLRLAGDAPFADRLRAIRHWGADRWISFGLVATGWLLGTVATAIGPLRPAWLHYVLLGVPALIMVAGVLLWPRRASS
jgi:hypothetical protein